MRASKKSEIPIRCSYTSLSPIADLKPHPKNPNHHGSEQLALYAKILRHQGWRKPILVSKQSGFIVAGHGAWLTAKANGWGFVPVDFQEFESEADELAHMIADNRLPQLSEIDESELRALTDELSKAKFDIGLAGLTDSEIASLNASVAPVQLKEVKIQSPPKMAWVLIGVPITDFAAVQPVLDSLPASAVIKSTANDQEN